MTRALRGLMIVVAVLATGAGCVTADGAFKKDGLKRAAFDLACPEEQVTQTVLVRNDGLGCFGSQVGVQGCGKRATYRCNNYQEWELQSPVSSEAQ